MRITVDCAQLTRAWARMPIDQPFQITYGLIDLCAGKKAKEVSSLQKISALKLSLSNIPPASHVIIEKQPTTIGSNAKNSDATMIANLIAYHYIDHNVQFISPQLKSSIYFINNQATFAGGPTIGKSLVVKKDYRERKAQSVANFQYYLSVFKVQADLPKKQDDIADAFMNAMAYIKKNNKEFIV